MILLLTEITIKTMWWITYQMYHISYYIIYKEYPKSNEQIHRENNNKKIEQLEAEIIEMKNNICALKDMNG